MNRVKVLGELEENKNFEESEMKEVSANLEQTILLLNTYTKGEK